MNNLEVGNKIINTNGKEYVVLRVKGNYTLLVCVSEFYGEFVVAHRLEEYKDGLYNWCNGSYYIDLIEAMDALENK